MKNFINKYCGEILLALITASAVMLTVMLNYGNSKLRLIEIANQLAQSVPSSRDIDYSGLVVQYRFRMDLYRSKITQVEADLIEMRALSMFPDFPEPRMNYKGALLRSSALVVNMIKLFFGKPQLLLNGKISGDGVLESAYFYEKNNLYSRALEKYDMAIKNGITSGQKRGIMLHQGFCLSLTGDIAGAMEKYQDVISLYPDDAASVTASILMNLLKDFTVEAERVKRMPDSPDKMEKLFRLIAFTDSLRIIDKMEREKKSAGSMNMRFYKARCLESLGQNPEAFSIYQSLLKESPGSEYAKNANRRIFLISIKSGLEDEGKEVTQRNNSFINDSRFQDFIDEAFVLKSLRNSGRNKTEISSGSEMKPVLDNAKKDFSFIQRPVYRGRTVTFTTLNGDIISGIVTDEDSISITVNTAAGEAVIMRKAIKKAEVR